MSDPGTTYRSHEEVIQMRSTKDPIRGLARCIASWGLATADDLKVTPLLHLPKLFSLHAKTQEVEKEVKNFINEAVEEAKSAPEPLEEDLWKDVYDNGQVTSFRRGRERGEVRFEFIPCDDV